VLGALTSIIVIWAIIAWLAFEATDEIIKGKVHIDNPMVMLITAFISLACNIFNLIALGHFPCMPGN
jgi:Co/Zn/Cd efflux system component